MNQNGMMEGMSGLMWGMGFYGLFLLVVVILLVAALVKYLFFDKKESKSDE